MRLRSALFACLTLTGAFSAAAPTYHLTDIGTFGGVSSSAYGINNLGQVTGVATIDQWTGRAFLYSDGIMTDLGTLGGTYSIGIGINSAGQVVGESYLADTSAHAFLYSGGIMADLGTLGGWDSVAYAINDAGEVVGWACNTFDLPEGTSHAFLYSGGFMADLGVIPGAGDGAMSWAYAINNFGQVVGQSGSPLPSGGRAFVYSGGVMADLDVALSGSSAAHGINDSGQIVGGGYSFADGGAFLYSNGAIVDLGKLQGTSATCAGKINNRGDVVGYCVYPDDITNHGFLYTGGAMFDLNSLLDSSGTGWTITYANGINDSGQIAADAINSATGQYRGVLLTPNAGLAGTVSLQDFAGDKTAIPATVEIRKPGTTTVVQSKTIKLNADGTFSFPTTLSGTYDVSVKASHWLRKTFTNVVLTGNEFVSGLTFPMVNGDVNGDNVINLADAVAISMAWNTKRGDPKYNPNADLNGDGTINLADAVIVSKNWRKTGDR